MSKAAFAKVCLGLSERRLSNANWPAADRLAPANSPEGSRPRHPRTRACCWEGSSRGGGAGTHARSADCSATRWAFIRRPGLLAASLSRGLTPHGVCGAVRRLLSPPQVRLPMRGASNLFALYKTKAVSVFRGRGRKPVRSTGPGRGRTHSTYPAKLMPT